MKKLGKIKKKHIVYVDEAGISNQEYYPYGCSHRGERSYDLTSSKKTERVSLINALRKKNLFAPLTFEGSCNRYLFQACLTNCLIPLLKPGDVIVIYNASFHHGKSIEEVVELARC